MFDVSKIIHADLGLYDDVLWYLYVKIVDRKLVEMMGRVNLGLNVRMVVMWVESVRFWGFEKLNLGLGEIGV